MGHASGRLQPAMRLAEWTTRTPIALSAALVIGTVLAGPRDTVRRPAPCRAQPPAGPVIAGLEIEVTGDVIAPPVFADARPYPRGMVIAPPDSGDPMTIVAPGERTIEQILFAVFGALMTIHA